MSADEEELDKLEYKIPQELDKWKEVYHDTVEKVYNMYKGVKEADQRVPLLDDPTRDFRGNDSSIASMETLDEFVDRYHPLWREDREACFESLSKQNHEDSTDLAMYINKKWGNQPINTSQNLSNIVRISETNPPSHGNGHPRPVVDSQEDEPLPMSDLEIKHEYLCSVDINRLQDIVLEKEEDRLRRFRALQNRNSNARPDHDHQNMFPGEEMYTRSQVERIVKGMGQRRNWGVEATSQAVMGVNDTFETKSLYSRDNNEVTIPRSHLDEILAMEEAYHMITSVYNEQE